MHGIFLCSEKSEVAKHFSDIKKRNKKINYLILTGIVILVVFSIWTFRLRPIESETLEVNFSVGSTTGIIVDTDKLYFGRLVPGGSSERAINIENGYSYPLKVKISATQNIMDYIFIDGDFIIEPGSTAKIPITLKIPESMPYGDYAGKIRFDLIKG